MKISNKTIFAVAALTLSANAISGVKKKVQPNILFIFGDDMRYTGVHACGGQMVKTPNIDALAQNGVVFTHTYLMGSFTGATCMPSRCMLNSGRSVFELGGIGHDIPKTNTTLGEAFRNAGYNTFMTGKWHQDTKSLVRSFNTGSTIMGLGAYLTDHFRMPLWDWDPTATFAQKDAYLLTYDANKKVVRRALLPTDKRGPIGTEKTGPHSSEIFADNAIQYLQSYKDKKPFYMYVAFHAPHDPRQAPQKYYDMYPQQTIQLPPSYMPQHPFDNGDMTLRDEALAPWPRTPEIARQQLADYYAIITHLDDQVGRVIAALKASGQYDNTIIIYCTDSGLGVGCHGLMGKQNVYDEDGLHVPLIYSGNLIQDKGKRYDALNYIYDIYPTACEMANVPIPASVTGKSLVPVMTGKTDQVRDYTYHAYRQFQRAYRKGDYKLIEFVRAKERTDKKSEPVFLGSRVTLLFNLKNDPWEVTNLAFLPENQQLVKTMQNEMRQKAIELHDTKESVGTEFDFWDFY